jgi:hypothetical protein
MSVVERIFRDTAYNPRFGLAEAIDDYLGWMEVSRC